MVSWTGQGMSWNGWMIGMRSVTSKKLRSRTHKARITGYFGCFVGEVMPPREPIFASQAGAKWFRTFVTRRSGFVVRFPVKNQRKSEEKYSAKLTRNQSSRESETRPKVY